MAENDDYSQFQGKRVTLVYTPKGKTEAVEVEAHVESTSPLGLVIKPKGKTNLELVEASQVEDVNFLNEKPKALAVKTLKVIEHGAARSHLLERHAFTLAAINEMDEATAVETHGKIDHEGLGLGHVHGSKDATPRADAVAAESETDAA